MKKNLNVKTYILPATGLVALSLSFQSAEAAQAQKPNVIFVLTDDQGYGDLGCHGNEIIKTPNIDNFYSDAVRFTDFHVSPTSAPTRSALMTGRYSNRVGVWHTIGGRSMLWEDEVTLADVLSANGYACAIYGKWHLGDNYPSRPEDKGFSEVLVHGGGGISQGPDYWNNDYFDDHYRHNGEWVDFDGFCTDIFFDNALSFIEENKDNPFFCYISLNAPHGPLNVPEKYLNMYKDNDKILPDQQRFYGMITNVDDNFGIMMKKLEKLGIKDNTIVIFMTDNGTATGVKTVKGVTYGHTGGIRGTKNSEYDGGHKVPFIISYPNGNVKGGYDIDVLTSHIDFMPTLIDLCDLRDDVRTKEFDGRSLMPLLVNKNVAWKDRSIIVDSQRRQNLVKWLKSAVMIQDWRLVNGKELYDMKADPMQLKDVAAEYPEKVAELRAEYEAWWQSLKDDGSNERYAYIVAGTPYENPVRISAHDMHVEDTRAHDQNGARRGSNPLGIFKIEIAKTGTYTIELCRYPKESGLKFNSDVPEIPTTTEIALYRPAAKEINIVSSALDIAQYSPKKNVDMNQESVVYTLELEAGRYDLKGLFIDDKGVTYPPYYMYIEKK